MKNTYNVYKGSQVYSSDSVIYGLIMTHNQKIWVSRKESASRPLVTDPKDVLLFVENGNSCYAKLIVMWQGRDLPSLTYSIMSSNKRFYRVKEPQGKLIKHEAVLIYLKLKSPFLE